MTLPSFNSDHRQGKWTKPRICLLQIFSRDTPDQKLALLIVERQETYRYDERDGSLYESSIQLFYERVQTKNACHRSRGSFTACYHKESPWGATVSLTSSSLESAGAIFLDLPGLEGQRIGTYLMNEIVTWAQQWPSANVMPVELLSGQAHADNKVRRNRFYEQFGLVFDYSDLEQRQGSSRPTTVESLRSTSSWTSNIRELNVQDYIVDLLHTNELSALELGNQQRIKQRRKITRDRSQGLGARAMLALRIILRLRTDLD